MRLSYIIITHNRRGRLLETLQRLVENTALDPSQWEVIVVDNASGDGTSASVYKRFPWATVIQLDRNEGMPARNHALAVARGEYLVFLDDDSYPQRDTIPRALGYFSGRPSLGALVMRCLLPSGAAEAPAFPCVTMGGASIVRASVIEYIGGFAPEFFRQAEEYDFSFRLWQAGFTVERFEDLYFRHDKDTLGARSSDLTHRMDLRNNLILVERYLPRRLRGAYRADWIRRYATLALHDGHREAVKSALQEAREWAQREAHAGRHTLDDATVEMLFDLDRQCDLVRQWKLKHGLERVVIADFSKNIYATWRACRQAGLIVTAIADDRPAFRGKRYRGLPILDPSVAIRDGADGVVLSNVNPSQIDSKLAQLHQAFPAGPVLRLWHPRYLANVQLQLQETAA